MSRVLPLALGPFKTSTVPRFAGPANSVSDPSEASLDLLVGLRLAVPRFAGPANSVSNPSEASLDMLVRLDSLGLE